MNEGKQVLYSEVSSKDKTKTWIYVLFFSLIATFTPLLIFVFPSFWLIGIIISVNAVIIGGLVLLVRWHAKNSAYECPECATQFELTAWQDFISPNLIDKKYVKCPTCNKRVSAKELTKKKR